MLPVALCAIVLCALTACSGSASPLVNADDADTPPSVGECWNVYYDDAAADATWLGDSAIPCGEPHEAYTYAVVTVKSDAASWVDPKDTATANVSIESAASSACEKRAGRLLPTLTNSQRRLRHFFYLPSLSEWKQGARWVRCDVGIAKVGSLVATPALTELPRYSDLVRQVADDPTTFLNCVVTSDPTGSTGPLDDPDSRIADCAAHPQWSLDAVATVPGDAYPGDAVVSAFVHTTCQALANTAGLPWWAYFPDETRWNEGSKQVTCWLFHDTTPSQNS
jgi:hypothetical protein